MPPEKVVAIHQPNFLPWLGYFDKIARSDVFVLLDDVQFPKTGGTWTNRVRLMVGGGPAWITVPVKRNHHGVQRVDQVRIDDARPWRATLRKTLAANYARTPCFAPTMALVDAILAHEGDGLALFNVAALRRILESLGWRERSVVLSSELGCSGQGTARLVAISKAVGADAYLAGGGAGTYQDDALFAREGVRVVPQDFHHPVYPQSRRGFHPGLSVVDALFEVGAAATSRLLVPAAA